MLAMRSKATCYMDKNILGDLENSFVRVSLLFPNYTIFSGFVRLQIYLNVSRDRHPVGDPCNHYQIKFRLASQIKISLHITKAVQ